MERFWEIDALRGLALIFMVAFNYSFAFYYLKISISEPKIGYAYAIASTFILVSGISMTLFYNQCKKNSAFRNFLSRGLKIFGFGIIITLVTFLSFPKDYILFGILHLIGFSTIAGYFFIKRKKLNLILGSIVIFLGFCLQNFRFDFSWLLWLGFVPSNFQTFDYFPIIPWFGLMLVGIAVGNILYRKGKRTFKIMDMSGNFIVKFLSFLGRNSLKIYLLHQPFLIFVLLLLGFKIF
jgi:uncharacterized membrane protein